jgi:TonB family protein
MGPFNYLSGKKATDKYGEKGVNGVYEITTRKKAIEMGLKPPFPRLAPGDYPTFLDGPWYSFNRWVGDGVQYPPEAKAGKIEGWVTIDFKVGLDGTISDIRPETKSDKLLSDEVIKVIKSAPKWEPPKNPAVDEPFSSSVTIGFRLPDQIVKEPPYVVVEEMPMFPGGDKALLDYIKSHTQYPEAAKAKKIQGKVILRFMVNTDGNAEAVSVLRGVDPILDAEAVKVVSGLTGFKPGMQGGKPVNVWYMVPVNFSLPADTTK